MKGIIVVNAYYFSGEIQYQPTRLQEEFAERGVSCEIIKNTTIPCGTEKTGNFLKMDPTDFCVFLDKDKYLLLALENSGIRVFNRPRTIRICDDKMETAIFLADRGIPMPVTIAGPLCYRPEASFSEEFERTAERELGYPFVFKECYGSRGTGVRMVRGRQEFERVWEANKTKAYLLQEYIEESSGRDIRVLMIGGKAAGAIERRNDTDFRSNLAAGGEGKPYRLDGDLVHLCEKTASVLEADYCGIDVLVSSRGYLICEVNSNAFFGGFEKVTGINAAGLYADHILRQVQKQTEKRGEKNGN